MFNIYASPHYKDRKYYSTSMLQNIRDRRLEHLQKCKTGHEVIEHLTAIRAIRLIQTEKLIGVI